MTNGGYLLKRGDTFDVEDSRMTHRLRVAHGLLKSLGAEMTWEHCDYTMVEYGRVKHACTDRCKAIWPEWVTTEMFDKAFALADVTVAAKAAANRSGGKLVV